MAEQRAGLSRKGSDGQATQGVGRVVLFVAVLMSVYMLLANWSALPSLGGVL